jgi:hypothetical protein
MGGDYPRRHVGSARGGGFGNGDGLAAVRKWLPMLILASAQFIMVLDSSVMKPGDEVGATEPAAAQSNA